MTFMCTVVGGLTCRRVRRVQKNQYHSVPTIISGSCLLASGQGTFRHRTVFFPPSLHGPIRFIRTPPHAGTHRTMANAMLLH